MKSKFVLGILVLFFSWNSLNAAGRIEISKEVKTSFSKEFVNAKNVHWESFDDIARADFLMNNQNLSAYYWPDGELIALTRNVSPDQIPFHLLIQLKEKYGSYWITDLVEIYIDGTTQYYVTLNTTEKQLILKSNGTEYWETSSKKKLVPRR